MLALVALRHHIVLVAWARHHTLSLCPHSCFVMHRCCFVVAVAGGCLFMFISWCLLLFGWLRAVIGTGHCVVVGVGLALIQWAMWWWNIR